MSVNAFLSFLAGILLIFLIGWILTAPLKTTIKFVLNALLGGIVLLVLNLLSAKTGLASPFNAFNAMITGFLGLPGILLLIFIQLL